MNFNSDELLHAAVLREMERGERRDGLWAQALSASNLDKNKAPSKQGLKHYKRIFSDELENRLAHSKEHPRHDRATHAKQQHN